MARIIVIPKAQPSMVAYTKDQPRWGWWKAYCRTNFMKDTLKKYKGGIPV